MSRHIRIREVHTKPKLKNGDGIGSKGLVIIEYMGCRQSSTYESAKRMHFQKARCWCGAEFVRPEREFLKKKPISECVKCANKTRAAAVKKYRNSKNTHSTKPKTTKEKPISLNKLWPVPGVINGNN